MWALAVTLTLKIANRSFCMTVWLIMVHHKTKFGNKKLGSLEDIIWTNINILTLTATVTLNAGTNPFFSQDILAHDNVSSDQVRLPRKQQFMRKSHILIIWILTVTLTLKIATTTTQNSARHSGSWCCIIIPNLLTKCSVIQKISSEQTFNDILNLRCDLDLKRSNPIFSTGHSGLWCCTIKPSLVANRPAVSKIQEI